MASPGADAVERGDSPTIPLILIGDHELLTSALASLLEGTGQFTIVTTSVTMPGPHDDTVTTAALWVVDLDVPGGGVEAIRELTQAGSRVVVLSAFATSTLTLELLAAGVRGVLSKSMPIDALAASLAAAWAGSCVIDPHIAPDLRRGHGPLSERELRVLRAASDGAPIGQVALRVHFAPGTTRNILSGIIHTLGVANRHEAVAVARERGWIE